MMRESFKDRGLGFTRVAAVNGLKISESERSALNPGRTISDLEIAVRLSHRKCWQLIVDEQLPCAAIFEDDVILHPDAAAVLEDLEKIASVCGIVKLELWPERPASLWGEVLISGETQLRRLGDLYLGSAAYVVSLGSARKLLASSETLISPIDHFMFDPLALDFSCLASWQLIKPICVQMMFVADSPGAGRSIVELDRKHFRAQNGRARFRIAGFRRRFYRAKMKLKRMLGIVEYVKLCWRDSHLNILARNK